MDARSGVEGQRRENPIGRTAQVQQLRQFGEHFGLHRRRRQHQIVQGDLQRHVGAHPHHLARRPEIGDARRQPGALGKSDAARIAEPFALLRRHGRDDFGDQRQYGHNDQHGHQDDSDENEHQDESGRSKTCHD